MSISSTEAERFACRTFLTEVHDLAWVGYDAGGELAERDGPFTLIVPGVQFDRGHLSGLAAIRFADQPAAEQELVLFEPPTGLTVIRPDQR